MNNAAKRQSDRDNGRLFVIVHPFSIHHISEDVNQLRAIESHDYSSFPERERDYLEKITKFISSSRMPLLITQGKWTEKVFNEKIKKLNPKNLLEIIWTYGSPKGDSSKPIDGWNSLFKIIDALEPSEIEVAGAQLSYHKRLYGNYYNGCVGDTLGKLEWWTGNKIKLKKGLCLEY